MRLLTSQKNIIYDLIQKSNLDNKMFYFIEDNNKSIIKYSGTEFYFNFDEEVKNMGIASLISLTFSPGPENYVEKVYIKDQVFATKFEYFSRWLSCLIQEVNIVDKWTQLKNEISNFKFSTLDDSSFFNETEQVEIKTKIFTLKQHLETLNLPTDKLSVIEAKLDHLTSLTTSLTKTDWNSIFIGTLVTVIVALTLSTENGRQIWEYAKQVFSNLFLN